MPDTRREQLTICVVSSRVSQPNRSWRVRTAITISSSEALPARSPRPLMVHSTWRAPLRTAARELATASPRSLWQCTENTALSELGTRSIRLRIRLAELLRDVVAHGIRDVHRAGAGVDHRLEHAAQEIHLGAAGVLRGELHVVGVPARPLDRMHRLLHHLVRCHAQLLLHVDGRGGDEGVDARRAGPARASPARSMSLSRARARPHTVLSFTAGATAWTASKSPGTGDREARLDDVHPQLLQGLGDAHLLVPGHGRARALLAVAQGGIENDQLLFVAHALAPCSPHPPLGAGNVVLGRFNLGCRVI